jgi:hypothetical protein
MTRISSVPGSLQVFFDGKQGLGLHRDSSELFPLTDNIIIEWITRTPVYECWSRVLDRGVGRL